MDSQECDTAVEAGVHQEIPTQNTLELMELAGKSDGMTQDEIKRFEEILSQVGTDPSFQEQERGESPLMRAAAKGHLDAVELLISHGAPWNAIDRFGKCAGEYALDNGHQHIVDALVNAGVRAELVLGAIESRVLERGPATNQEYLKGEVEYTRDEEKLMDNTGDAVMMEWERPLMQIHAQVLCCPDGEITSKESGGCDRHILNVGFGMGIFDGYVQDFGAKRHTIIEAHPQVYKKIQDLGWDKKPGVTIHFGRWQDVIGKLADNDFDGIFFDTFGEYYSDMKTFQSHLPRLLREGGIYSFFNGLCPRNIFFHGVACQVVQLEMEKLGLSCDFHQVPVENSSHSDATWDGVKRRYWWNDTYYLPVCIKGDASKP